MRRMENLGKQHSGTHLYLLYLPADLTLGSSGVDSSSFLALIKMSSKDELADCAMFARHRTPTRTVNILGPE